MSGFLFSVMIGMAAVTVVFGWLAFLLAGRFLSDRESKIASFALMLGSPLNSAVGSVYTGEFPFAEEVIGLLVGLSVLWWLLFRRSLIND